MNQCIKERRNKWFLSTHWPPCLHLHPPPNLFQTSCQGWRFEKHTLTYVTPLMKNIMNTNQKEIHFPWTMVANRACSFLGASAGAVPSP